MLSSVALWGMGRTRSRFIYTYSYLLEFDRPGDGRWPRCVSKEKHVKERATFSFWEARIFKLHCFQPSLLILVPHSPPTHSSSSLPFNSSAHRLSRSSLAVVDNHHVEYSKHVTKDTLRAFSVALSFSSSSQRNFYLPTGSTLSFIQAYRQAAQVRAAWRGCDVPAGNGRQVMASR